MEGDMNEKRLSELREKYKDRELLKELSWGVYHDHSGYTSKADGEFLSWLCDAAYIAIKGQPQWIPVSERLPDAAFGCLVTVMDTNPVTMDEFENILPYFVGWDGEQWNDADGEQCPFEILAWMPLPKAYKVTK